MNTLNTGDLLPDFTAMDQDDRPLKSKDLLDGRPLVIYFYPKNFTPGCTREACGFRDQYEDFVRAGARVVGISGDSSQSHKRFSQRYELPFTLLSDTQGKLRRAFGVKKAAFGLLPGRETFIFDGNGRLIRQFSSLASDGHIRVALKEIKKLVGSTPSYSDSI